MKSLDCRLMSKEMKNTRVPKLRFPEFLNEPAWSERKLSEVLIEHGSKSTGVEEVFSVSVQKGLVNQIEHLGRSFSAASTDHYKRVLPGDVVYTKSPTGDFPYGIIKQSKISKPAIVSPLYGVFTPETNALGCILDAYFESPANSINYLSSIAQKGAKNTINITNDTFLSKSLFLPTNKTEQKKIAACLTSLDDLITAQSEKLKALQAHKKGLMQQLFPAEGETVPKVRFPEFLNEPAWRKLKLSEVLIEHGSKSTGVEEVFSVSVQKGLVNQIEHLGRSFSAANTDHYKRVLPGDIVYTKSPLSAYPFGIIKQSKVPTSVIVSPLYGVFTPETQALGSILDAYFESPTNSFNYLSSIVQKGAKNTINISNDTFLSKFLFLPTNKKEQQKIADCLTSLDNLITAQSQKLEALKVQKKGLMQQLFPNPNEMEA